MSESVLYRVFAGLLDMTIWGGELLGVENMPDAGPAIFVSNHARALGPIAVVSSLPLRLYPWVVADMLEWDSAAAYLNKDFIEPQLRFPPPLSIYVSYAISQVSVRLLRRVEAIPVWHGVRVNETYRISLDYLKHGRCILIFPEDSTQAYDKRCQMSPFIKSFTRLGELYFEYTRKILRFYPLTVHPALRQVQLGKPLAFNPINNPVNERIRIKSMMESIIRNTYIEMTLKNYAGIPQPH